MFNVNLKKKNFLVQTGCALLLAAATGTASAALETESNNIFADANFADPGVNSGVIGDLTGVSNDVDIWKFDLVNGGRFSATISDGPLFDFNGFDPIIVLFMKDSGNYFPVAGNTPFSFGTSLSFTPYVTGTYFLTVSAFGNSPQDAFNNDQFDSQFHTNELFGFGTSFDHFGGTSSASFDYNLSLNGAVSTTPAAVPVPAAVWLFGSGLLGLAGIARRKS